MAQATLNGIITDDGGLPCEGRFQYGLTIALGTFTPWIGGALWTGDPFSSLITGLLGNSIYYFRAEARNASGTGTAGSTLNFITTGAPATLMEVLALPAIDITERSGTIRGMVLNSLGQYGMVRFHYGATTAYGMKTPWQQGFTTGDEFHADIGNLAPESGYHYRAELHVSPSVFSRDAAFWTLAEVGGMVLLDEQMLQLLEEAK